MYIKDLHIEGFGIYHELILQDLPQGLVIFLGENEAGKSTCLEFLRTMLTGFPQGRQGTNLKPLRGGRFGGSLNVITENDQQLTIARFKEKNLGLTLTMDGQIIPPARLNELLAGVGREVYTRVFGFSLEELATKLSPDDVQDALYSATFGAGLNDPQAVLKFFNDGMSKLFTPRGTSAPINVALNSYRDIAQTIQNLEDEHSEYDALSLAKVNLSQTLEAVKKERQAIDAETRLLELRLSAWQQWDEWQAVGLKLEDLPAYTQFPEHGAQSLDQLLREERQKSYALARQSEKCKKLQENLAALTPNPLLLVELPNLLSLTEYKGNFRTATQRLPAQEANCKRLEDELATTLLRLGPKWNCERIRQTDLSLFSHNALEALAIELRSAQSRHEAALDALEGINAAVAENEQAVKMAQDKLDQIIVPEQILNENERDDLRQDLAQLEEAKRQLPEKEDFAQNAAKTFQRSWKNLNLREAPLKDQDEQLQTLLKEQHKVRDLAAQVQNRLADFAQTEQLIEQLDARIKSISLRKDALKSAYQEEAPDRTLLDEQANAVRHLRTIWQAQERDLSELELLEEELANEPTPKSHKILTLIILGSVLALVGSSMLILNLVFHLKSLLLTPDITLPLDLLSGYLTLFAGVLGIWGGSPHDSREVKRRLDERLRKEKRVTAAKEKIAHQKEDLEHYAAIAQVEPIDNQTLEACEVRISRDRENCIRSEHYQTGMRGLEAELEAAQAERQKLSEKLAQQEELMQKAKHSWHECLTALGVDTVPAATSAQTFLTQVEMAELGLTSLKEANKAVANLEANISNLHERILGYATLAQSIKEKDPASKVIISHAKDLLQSMREADRICQEKLASAKELEGLKTLGKKLKDKQAEADLELKKCKELLASSTERWKKCLQDLGLDQTLNPQTAKAALECMQDCLSLESTLENAHDVLEQIKQSIAAFSTPISKILERSQEQPKLLPDGSIDWLVTFEELCILAQKAELTNREREQVLARIREEETELHSCQAELAQVKEELKNLLAQASCQTPDEFLVKNRIYHERLELLKRRDTLEANLKIVAGHEPLDQFLRGFANEDRPTQEVRQTQNKLKLAELNQKQDDLLKKLATLEAKLDNLSQSQELAAKLQEREVLTTTINDCAKTWAKYALAHALLQKTRQDFEQERQPQVLRQASEIFQRITQGKWKSIVISLDKNRTLRMLPKDGQELVAPEALSRGTQEQAYLALRLAYIMSHAAFAETLPLLMDEVLVNFDHERASATAQELARMSQGGFGKEHQIFYFTCHKETVEILKKQAQEATIYHVANGQISPSLDA